MNMKVPNEINVVFASDDRSFVGMEGGVHGDDLTAHHTYGVFRIHMHFSEDNVADLAAYLVSSAADREIA